MSVLIQEEPPRQPEVEELLQQSDRYAAALYPAESNHMVDLATLEGDTVSFFVARLDGQAVGCCALLVAGDGTGEIKRLFVEARARGKQAGRALLTRVEARAVERGLAVLRLETGIHQPEAIGLYRAFGYREIPPFGPYGPDPLSLSMEKRLPDSISERDRSSR